jgi:AraC family transcriptional regulator
MKPSDSRAEYQRRMHSVLEHIDANLDQPLDLAKLAQIAHFSPLHFHRLFTAWTGETLGDFLGRRRLEVAATRLAVQPGLSVSSAALTVGFGSAEAFSHAFKARFGASPSAWRKNHAVEWIAERKRGQGEINPSQASGASVPHLDVTGPHHQETALNVKIVEREPTPIAYLRHTGPYGDGVRVFWQNRVHPWMVAHDLLNRPRYGISHDDPSITAPTRCRYDACVEVPKSFVPTRNAQTATLPGGRYAMLHFEGTGATIGAAWQRLLRDWLPSSGMQLDSRPLLECYPASSKHDPKTGAFDCELCMPFTPL